MIASVQGTIQHLGSDHVVISTAGIGWLVYAPRPVLAALGNVGDAATLLTVLVVREDAMTLYGFSDADQRATFEVLLGVSRVGPKVALGILAAASPAELRTLVATQDVQRLARVPGIGKRTAERLLLELKGKLDTTGLPAAAPADAARTGALALNEELSDLLQTLGYSSSEAAAAVASLPADAPPDLEERLRLALRYFGSV